MTSQVEAKRAFFSVNLVGKKTVGGGFIFPVDHWSLAHQSQEAESLEVFSLLEMDAFESFHFNTNKCLCHSAS